MPYRFIAGLLLAICTASSQAQVFSFGLWGDMPYKKAGDESKIPALLKSINQSDIAFSFYDGDIKDGSSQCTYDIYASALAMFGQLNKPVVYVPGDNEWTDCHRLNNGGYDGLDRLAYLRKTMFPTTRSLGKRAMPLIHQGPLGDKFVENTRFAHRGIVTEDKDESQGPAVSGYRNFIQSIVAETEQFAGQVLLVHGDTHFFKVDKPLHSPTKVLANLTRLQTFGSPLIHWVRVIVEPGNPNVFTIQPVIVKQ